MGDYIDKIASRARKGGDGPDAVVVVEEEGGGYGGVKKAALDDLAKVLNVSKEAREDFDGALTDLIDACMKDKGSKPKPKATPVADEADDEEATEE